MIANALFDATQQYRYRLSREWLLGTGTCCFVMLNPSTADAETLDPTIRRCVRFAQQWGYQRLEVVNLFAYRSTDPKALLDVADPEGQDNMMHILAVSQIAEKIVCAWGRSCPKRYHDFGTIVARILSKQKPLYCLGLNADGSPKHPLFLPKDTVLTRFIIPYA